MCSWFASAPVLIDRYVKLALRHGLLGHFRKSMAAALKHPLMA